MCGGVLVPRPLSHVPCCSFVRSKIRTLELQLVPFELHKRVNRCSLSPRERVRVRGKAATVLQAVPNCQEALGS